MRHGGGGRSVPIERLQACTLLHTGVELNDVETEEDEERMKTSDAVDGGQEDNRAAGVAEEKVIKMNILRSERIRQ